MDGRAVYGGQELILEKGFDCTKYPSAGEKRFPGIATLTVFGYFDISVSLVPY